MHWFLIPFLMTSSTAHQPTRCQPAPPPCECVCRRIDPCHPRGYLYIEAFGAANFASNLEEPGITTSFDTGYLFSGSLGCSIYYGLRIEAEFAYRRNTIDQISFFGRSFPIPGHFHSTSWMGNLIWEMPLDRWLCTRIGLKPIVGGGLGWDDQHVHGDMGILTFTQIEKGFSWQVMTGLAYRLLNCLDISVDYKCHKGRMENLYSHSVGAALNYHYYSW